MDHEGKETGAEPIQIDDGRRHPIGFSAQQAEAILADWIVTVPGGIVVDLGGLSLPPVGGQFTAIGTARSGFFGFP